MNIRTRMITLASALLVAIVIAPQSAIATKPTSPTNPTVLTPPYEYDFFGPRCQQTGTGVCNATATADSNTGGATVSGTATAVYNPVALPPTGTADAQPYGAMRASFKVLPGGASSVTFTVTTNIDAIAESSALNSVALVDLVAFSGVWGSCTSCTVWSYERIVDTNPGTPAPSSLSEDGHTFTFVLKSASGDRLRGNGFIYLYLNSFAYARSGILTDAFAHVSATAEFKSVTATFVS